MELSSKADACPPPVKDLRIVLLGKTGAGKSATGNTILGREAFSAEMSPTSVTRTCTKETADVWDRRVSVIDTPGIFDTSGEAKDLTSESEKCIEMSLPGPHVFLLVIRLGVRFTEEEKNAVRWITENFGEESSKHTCVVFTRGDELGATGIERYLARNADLRKLTEECKAGYVVFDNTCVENRAQVAELLARIELTVMENGGHYSSSIYREVQRRLWWRNMAETVGAAAPLLLAATSVSSIIGFPKLILGGAMVAVMGWWSRPKEEEEPKTKQ